LAAQLRCQYAKHSRRWDMFTGRRLDEGAMKKAGETSRILSSTCPGGQTGDKREETFMNRSLTSKS
jgi:hypothetical protein